MTTFLARSDDLTAIRFARSPVWETLHAVRLYKDPRGRPYHQEWLARAARATRALDLTPLLAVNPLRGSVPDFLTPPPRTPAPRITDQLREIRATPAAQVAEELDRCRATLAGAPREQVTGMLADPAGTRETLASLIQQAWHLLIAPSWAAIEALLDGDVAYRSRQLANSGLRRVIGDLHEKVSMDERGVHVADRFQATISLAGRGLVLMPSAFIWPGIAVVTDEPWQPTIAYPARGIAALWERPPPAPQALVRLLGRTRGTLLASLDRPASTTALAQRHSLSPAGASRHLIALRDAGLVTGSRHGHEVRYARTRLGTELIRSASGPPP